MYLLFGSVPSVGYADYNLYNLYCQAFKKAGFSSSVVVHLPRHMLGYRQVKYG